MSPKDTRVDWPRVLLDLRRAGYSMRAFADSLGIARSTITGWMAGSEPKHADGEKLIAFWSYATGRPGTSAPREARLPGIRPYPTHMMRPIPTEVSGMTKATSRTRAIQTPGQPVQAVAPTDEAVTEATEAEQHQADAAESDPAGELEAAQALADQTKRPVLTREGWVLPNVPVLPNLNRF